MPEPRAKPAAGAGLARRKAATALQMSASGIGQLSALVPDRLAEPLAWVGHSPFVMWFVERWEPQQIVELGVHSGNSFFAMCQAVKRAGLRCSLVGIDSWKGDAQAGFYGAEMYETVRAHCDATYRSFASLMRCQFDDAVAKFADGSIDLLHIDGYHDYDAVRHDYQSWLPKMSGQGVILFHDTQVREPDTFGVWRLWAEIKRYYPHCEFVHSHGLGVLFVGGELSKPRQALRDALCDPAAFDQLNSLFSTLGTAIASERGASIRSDALANEVRELTREVELRGASLTRLHGVLEAVRAERDRNAERAQVAGELEATLATVRAEHDSLSARLSQLGAEMEARDRARAELQAARDVAVAELGQERERLQETQSAHESELSVLRSQLESARADVVSRSTALAHLHAVLETTRAEHDGLAAKLVQLGAEIEARDRARAELQAARDAAVAGLESARAELESARVDVASRASALARLHAIVEVTRAERDDARSRAARIEEVEETLAAVRAERDSLSEGLSHLATERRALRDQLDSARADVASRASDLARLHAIVEATGAERDDLRGMLAEAREQLVQLGQNYSRMNAQITAAEQRAANLETLVTQRDGVVVSLRTELSIQEARVASLDREVVRLTAQLRSVSEEAHERNERIRYLDCVVDAMRGSTSWRIMAPARLMARLCKSNPWSKMSTRHAVRKSGLFDPVYYVLANGHWVPDGDDPLEHFLREGGRNGLDPSPFFRSAFYLQSNPDILVSGVNPLVHYIRHGRQEGRKPHPSARTAGNEPEFESLEARAMRIIRESGMFDEAYYLDHYPDVRADELPPVDHFVLHGWREGRNPSALFDTRFYLREYLPDDAQAVNPLLHYIERGRLAGNAVSSRYRDAATKLTRRDRPLRLIRAIDRRLQALIAVTRHRGGVLRLFSAAGLKLKTQGPAALVRSARHHLLRQSWLDAQISFGPSGGVSPAELGGADDLSCASARTVPPGCKVLFIGCDGLLAGSQMLLLHAQRWLRKHTSLDVKTILVNTGGELRAEYERCGSVTVWPDFVAHYPDTGTRRARIRELFGDVDLVYGNTVVAASIYSELECLGVPVLTHIHELEGSIRSLCSPKQLDELTRLTTRFIACSAPVAQNLVESHGIDAARVCTVNAFIERRPGASRQARAGIRRRLGIAESSFVVVGCGTIYARKGVDLFVETAIRVKELGLRDVQFLWIGEQYWDLHPQSRQTMAWSAVERRIEESGLVGKVRFLGAMPHPRDHFEAADVFYLPSREDPFPLVCLEAAQVGTPVVCFEGCGGMPDFVADDAGVVVPRLDVDAAAVAIKDLYTDPVLRERLGDQAAAKLARLHTDDVAMPHILREIHATSETVPLVSVVVPAFNHAQFLSRRMESILSQSFRDVEILVLDDSSTDRTIDVAMQYAHLPHVRVLENERNSGSAFRQWAKGLELARGEYVWIAESDDDSAPEFLREMLSCLADPAVALAYSDSCVVDEHGRSLESYARYYAELERSYWRMDHVLPADIEVNYGLGVKNTIPNVSAVVFRRSLVTREMLDAISSMQFAGDWMFYLRLAKGHKIAYRSVPLNVHRKHSSTLTYSFNRHPERAQRLLDEVRSVHEWVLDHYPVAATFRRRLAQYIEAQVRALAGPAYDERDAPQYPVARLLAEADSVVSRTSARSLKVAFVTTNDSSHDGGSEQLWIHAAQRMTEDGNRVMVVIRRWDPEPYFITEFSRLGIEIAFKDSDPMAALRGFEPDLVVVNIGDQDDGIEWYAACRASGMPYVIVNHLTKEPRYWPIREAVQADVRAGYLGAMRVFFTSRNNRSLMERRLGCLISNAELFHNPLFLDRSRQLAFPPMGGPIRLAMPARMLNIHKGQDVAIEVFGMQKWRERPIELHLYGNGPDEPSLRERVTRMGQVRVRFHDPKWELPRPDMEAIWTACHGLLMPSFMEGMPLVLLNAMFYARVPIVTDIGGHREVVEDGVSGFIAREPTVESLDAALERAWARLHGWEEIGRAARDSMLRFAPEDPISDFVEKLRLAVEAGRWAAE